MNTLSAQSRLELIVEVVNIKEVGGTIRACLINDEKDFLSNCYASKMVLADKNRLVIKFNNLDIGTYCISLYHDIDNNEKLNRDGMFGMPSEPYGFSNNPRSWFGPPSFNRCTFELKIDSRITINL